MAREVRNYYDILGVSPQVTMVELKRAYRERAKTLHPDHNPDSDAQARFRSIQEAWNVLRDPVERTFYDRGLGIKSNWVDDASRETERKKARRSAAEAARQAAEATAEASGETGSENAGDPPPRTSARPESKTEGGDEGPRAGAKSEAKASAGQRPGASERAAGAGERSAGTGERASTGAASEGFRARPTTPPPRGADGSTRRTRRASARFGASAGAASRPVEGAPVAAGPQKLPWYRERALRILLFVANAVGAALFFVSQPERGVYFLVLAFGLEILYRLQDLKDASASSFRPPPRP